MTVEIDILSFILGMMLGCGIAALIAPIFF